MSRFDELPGVAKLNGDAELSGHLVQFYENDPFLIDGVTRFIGAGLRAGHGGVVIATKPHRDALEQRLSEHHIDVADLRAAGRYQPFDAAETLSSFMVGGWPDQKIFEEVIGGAIARVTRASTAQRVRAFGEMVALLWAEGQGEAAIRLEALWNDLAKKQSFSLLCGYPIGGFNNPDDSSPFTGIAGLHSMVIPAESYSTNVDGEQRLRLVAELQQKAAVLESEIAARIELEEQLQTKIDELAEVDRRKDEFLAMLGHELRNPLSPVTTALHLMRLHGNDASRTARAREIIERQVEHMTRLVDDLLDVSRITRGKIDLRQENVALSETVDRAVEIAQPLIDERGHRLMLELPERPIELVGDSARLEQVLANLLNNAAKYTDVGGHIWLRATVDGRDAVISVRDDGDGLTPEMRTHVFDLFVQGPDARRRVRGGLGIGLTLVRRLVQLHGGTIEARSAGPGMGSEFIVRLPLRGRVSAESSSRASAGLPQPAHRQRVLIVDDNADAAESLAELLRDCGHNVRTAADGSTALRDAPLFRPEVVILDIGLPEIDGYEVARRLRGDPRLGSATLIALTGYGEERHRRRTEEAGFNYHFTKPIDFDRLEALLAGTGSAERRPRSN